MFVKTLEQNVKDRGKLETQQVIKKNEIKKEPKVMKL